VRWILCGKNDAAALALEYALAQGDEVLAIGGASDDGRDGWQRSFRATAERLEVPFEQPARINDPACIERLADYGADALISIQYEQILRKRLFEQIGCPCLNLHFALLPRHRGVAPIAWAIQSGDREAGVTLHHMVPEIDAGDVIAQRAVKIGNEDTARRVYDAVSAAAFALFRESHPFPPSLLSGRQIQSDAEAVYHRAGDFDFSQREIDWAQPAPDLHRWLRAMIFPPLQLPETLWRGQRCRIERIGGELGPATDAQPGSVVGASAHGIEVATADGTLRITRWLGDDDSQPPVARGDRLGIVPHPEKS
jgi:methionyl-tRNA formyltransferase